MNMTESPRRPTLRLKFPPPLPQPSVVKPKEFKCRPCGTVLQVAPELADEDSVRCPSCNARLGLARDFRSDPPNFEKLRAREAPPRKEPAPTPGPRAPVVTVTRAPRFTRG